jgi:hypothetical protein
VAGYLNRHRSQGRADSLSIQEFSRELRYGVAASTVATVEDPLGAALVVIEAHPQHLQSLLLARILTALTYGVGQFRKAEVFGLDRGMRAVAIALGNVRTEGTLPNEKWESAVDAAGAAQLGAKPADTAAAGRDAGEPKT